MGHMGPVRIGWSRVTVVGNEGSITVDGSGRKSPLGNLRMDYFSVLDVWDPE